MKRGFTLIELLVVVAIIAILMAILLPSMGRAREQARSTKCVSTLRQFATAANLYADESNNWLVPARNETSTFWFANTLFRADLNFTNNWGAYPINFICPNSTVDLATPYTGNLYRIENTYGMNYEDLPGPYYGYKRTSIMAPQNKLLFADANDKWISWWNSNLYTTEQAGGGSYTTAAAYRHLTNRINVAFFDGHAETLLRSQVDRVLCSNNNARPLWRPISVE